MQVIYTGLSVLSKAALDDGMSIFVFNFYRQATGSLLIQMRRKNMQSMSLVVLLKLFLCALFGLNMYNISLKLTSATLVAAAGNAVPAVTLCLALLLGMEVVSMRNSSGIAKVGGAVLCLLGVLVMAFYSGPAWITGTFLMVINNMAWAVTAVWQARILKEFPNRMLVAVFLCVFSALQLLVVAAVAERDFSRWKLKLDIRLLAIAYNLKGPVFFSAWLPLYSVFTMFCSSIFLGEIVHLGSILGGILLIGGLYSVLWGKSKEGNSNKSASCSQMNTNDGAQGEEQHNKPDTHVEAITTPRDGQV
ncbi:hypothetical protein HU200_062221 [Digitaria exilis]|uniref:WAT1-related protein n=1 Tax=Digitaria exilis TaxID=1010633 RepID=A0A835DYL4_9POAL|nr:hypothetical protein HU200_062221 [Digitaria exilis]